MTRHNARKTNKAVMYGVMGMAVLVLLVILMFFGWMAPAEEQGEEFPQDSTEIVSQ